MASSSGIIVKDEPIAIPHDLPKSMNWKDNVQLVVRNQGACMSCWAVTAIAVLEAVWQVKNPGKPFKPFSPQMLIDCVKTDPPKKDQDEYGCYILTALEAFKWLEHNEVYGEEDYPYVAERGPCKVILEINGGYRTTILRTVFEHPVAAVIDVYPEFIDLGDGIYEGPKKFNPKAARHAVTIIGYGTEGDGPTAKNYWIIMNTWGDGWGRDGFGRISRDHLFNGRYLLRRISYPEL